MIELTDHLKAIVPTRVSSSRAAITLGWAKTGPYMSISRAAWQLMKLPPWVVVSLSRSQIALEVGEEKDRAARRVSKSSLRVPARDIAELFSVKEGEKFVLPAVLEHGKLVADLPGTLVTRYQYRRRQKARASS